jgi:hypothetical protein
MQPPTHGVEKGVELFGRVEARWLRQSDPLDNGCSRLDLPDDPQFFTERIVLEGEQRDEMLRWFRAGAQRRRR